MIDFVVKNNHCNPSQFLPFPFHIFNNVNLSYQEDFAMQFPVRVSSSLTFDETLDLIKAAEKTLITVGKVSDKGRVILSDLRLVSCTT